MLGVFNFRSCNSQGIEQPEEENDLRKLQLMELAKLNGTLREDLMPRYRIDSFHTKAPDSGVRLVKFGLDL